MPELAPNCIILVTYFDADNEFNFACTHSASNWQVTSDGTIHTPPTARVVRFQLKGVPNPVQFAGFRVAADLAGLRAQTESWNTPPLGVIREGTPPGDTGTTPGPLTLTFPRQAWVYELAVQDATGVHWHDPRIYNDGSE